MTPSGVSTGSAASSARRRMTWTAAVRQCPASTVPAKSRAISRRSWRTNLQALPTMRALSSVSCMSSQSCRVVTPHHSSRILLSAV
ncbi:hypothetical protein [Streptomyces sp. NPDC047718]|uniref:hypothetical protein n=1 Tax=Streptomyces sp. NPDC047718 TaxID=3155479 RepID=UPI0033C029FC